MSNLSIYGDTSDASSDNDDDNMTVIEVGTTKMFKSNKNLENTKVNFSILKFVLINLGFFGNYILPEKSILSENNYS